MASGSPIFKPNPDLTLPNFDWNTAHLYTGPIIRVKHIVRKNEENEAVREKKEKERERERIALKQINAWAIPSESHS